MSCDEMNGPLVALLGEIRLVAIEGARVGFGEGKTSTVKNLVAPAA